MHVIWLFYMALYAGYMRVITCNWLHPNHMQIACIFMEEEICSYSYTHSVCIFHRAKLHTMFMEQQNAT